MTEECCKTKTVGGITFNYKTLRVTKKFNCKSRCIYISDEYPDKEFCFAVGNQTSSCLESEPTENLCVGRQSVFLN